MSPVTIRPYRGADEAALLALWDVTLTHDPITPAAFRTRVLLDPNFDPEGLLLAEDGAGLAGFVLSLTRQVPLPPEPNAAAARDKGCLEPEVGWITAFGVAPERRRQGIGTALFDAALAWLAGLGRRRVLISPYTPNYFIPGVDVDAYRTALAFLQKRGWQIVSEPISMRADLTGFRMPSDVAELAERLAAEGIAVRPVTSADLPELMPFIQHTFG